MYLKHDPFLSFGMILALIFSIYCSDASQGKTIVSFSEDQLSKTTTKNSPGKNSDYESKESRSSKAVPLTAKTSPKEAAVVIADLEKAK